jgi:hypothetical protein
MATQMSAVTLAGTTGQAYATGLASQLYFGLPLAMVILSLTVVVHACPRLHGASISSVASTCARGRLRRSCSSSGARCRWRHLAAPSVVVDFGWTLLVTVLGSHPMVLYTTVGGVQVARLTSTDVRRRLGMLTAVGILRWHSSARRTQRRCTWRRHRIAEGDRLSVRCAKPIRSGRAYWRPFPMLSYFGRDQEPGSTLPDGETDEARHCC